MASEAVLLELIGKIYDAAVDQSRWPQFLEHLAEVIDGHAVNLSHTPLPDGEASMMSVVRLDPEATRQYHDYFREVDPWIKRGIAGGQFRTGIVGLGRELLTDGDYSRTEFHADFGRKFGIRGGLSAVIRADKEVLALLNASERPHGRIFGPEERALVRHLLPHLQRALAIHQRISRVEDTALALEAAMDRLPIGLVLVDGSARALLVNTRAQRALAERDGLALRGGRLVARTGGATLQSAISRAIAIARGELHNPPVACVIPRAGGRRSLQVLVAPIRTISAEHPVEAACAAVFIEDPERAPAIPPSILRTFYGLTPAEARFAALLLTGCSVQDASRALAITLNTARTHLKRIFDKTDTSRQADLIRLLAGGVAQLDV
jgi:DNA-binding CsgD family transcriptional regulator